MSCSLCHAKAKRSQPTFSLNVVSDGATLSDQVNTGMLIISTFGVSTGSRAGLSGKFEMAWESREGDWLKVFIMVWCWRQSERSYLQAGVYKVWNSHWHQKREFLWFLTDSPCVVKKRWWRNVPKLSEVTYQTIVRQLTLCSNYKNNEQKKR